MTDAATSRATLAYRQYKLTCRFNDKLGAGCSAAEATRLATCISTATYSTVCYARDAALADPDSKAAERARAYALAASELAAVATHTVLLALQRGN